MRDGQQRDRRCQRRNRLKSLKIPDQGSEARWKKNMMWRLRVNLTDSHIQRPTDKPGRTSSSCPRHVFITCSSRTRLWKTISTWPTERRKTQSGGTIPERRSKNWSHENRSGPGPSHPLYLINNDQYLVDRPEQDSLMVSMKHHFWFLPTAWTHGVSITSIKMLKTTFEEMINHQNSCFTWIKVFMVAAWITQLDAV